MSSSVPLIQRLCVVDHGDQPVPILPDIKDHVAVYRIGILKNTANFPKITPTNRLYYAYPRFDFVRRIGIAFHRLAQMLARNDMHALSILHNM
jgi:hypothetical protein